MGTHLLASLGSKGKSGYSFACLRNAGSHYAESYCTETPSDEHRIRFFAQRKNDDDEDVYDYMYRQETKARNGDGEYVRLSEEAERREIRGGIKTEVSRHIFVLGRCCIHWVASIYSGRLGCCACFASIS